MKEEARQVVMDLQQRNDILEQDIERLQDDTEWLKTNSLDERQKVTMISFKERTEDLLKHNEYLKEELSTLEYRSQIREWSQNQDIGLEPDLEYENMRQRALLAEAECAKLNLNPLLKHYITPAPRCWKEDVGESSEQGQEWESWLGPKMSAEMKGIGREGKKRARE